MTRPAHEIGKDVVCRERDALAHLLARWADVAPAFDAAVDALLGCTGRVVVCGMGKSGQIGRKIASTLVSTGTPATFLHPAEGFHGDVGIVTARDIVIAISNSGSTREVMELIPTIRSLGARLLALTGPAGSPLARAADIALCWGELEEADPTRLVPTASAAVTLALGDALTVALMEKRGFGASDYRLFHPSGAIGAKLTLRVRDLLRGEATNPIVREDATFGETLEVITRSTLGGVNVVDQDGQLVGLVTDGDVRRTIQVSDGVVGGLLATPVASLMTKDPVTVDPDTFALDALRTMEGHKPRPVGLLPVVDAARRPVGLLHLHTLVQAGLGASTSEV
ncbi:MAG: KpsF/GutQ family sugar-phosphate isomerase [Planctomycetota bacterium]|nr:KpsF/GutQ family sugar-phosphate isomerase [Planctomycetota bacterium]MCB9825784.1 KpsF/GutQ family sugar-phosphate isomerase [Planctomycetota bacterium]MCB9901183.1 KpsF/GutQ family sugar-phosphate isomerase [Planctomycetota bacterium]